MNNISEPTKHIIDAASVATAVGTVMQILPSLAAFFTIVWTVIRIYETKTVQRLFRRKNEQS